MRAACCCCSCLLSRGLAILQNRNVQLQKYSMKHLKRSVTKKKELPILFCDEGGHRESAEIRPYSLSCFPHYRAMIRNTVYHSCTDFVWDYCSCSSSPFSASSLYLSHMHSSSSRTLSIHIWYLQLHSAGCALWTGLYWFPHIISNKCEQLWVVVCKLRLSFCNCV